MTAETSLVKPSVPDVPMPEPALFTHELIRDGGGVHLGCSKRNICEQAYEEGETSEEVREWYTADQMRAYAAAYMLGFFEPLRASVPALASELAEAKRLNLALQRDADKLASCDAALHAVEAERDALRAALSEIANASGFDNIGRWARNRAQAALNRPSGEEKA